MYFSPCSFALFRFSSRSARESFQCFKKPHSKIFYNFFFCQNSDLLKTVFSMALLNSLRFSFVENWFRQSINIIPSSSFFVV